jgi:RNA 3'-terminal phosphate cyclase (ATP)
VGSDVIEFRPQLPPSPDAVLQLLDKKEKKIVITADSAAASALLIFQAFLPFIIYAGKDEPHPAPVEFDISGGTNVSFAPTFEYVDQVLLPTLEERFGLVVSRKLVARGWSTGPGRMSRGRIEFCVHPLRQGTPLRPKTPSSKGDGNASQEEDLDVATVDASIIVPADMHESLQRALVSDLGELWPDVDVNFVLTEDSGADQRMYVLLVAKTANTESLPILRWGKDVLTSIPKKTKMSRTAFAEKLSRDVAKSLFEEVAVNGVVDAHLQDQLVLFQALAEGRTLFRRNEDGADGTDDHLARRQGGATKTDPTTKSYTDGNLREKPTAKLVAGDTPRMRKEKAREPFGDGSMHTQTARWVTAELLPTVAWYNKGNICDGAGIFMEKPKE